MLVFRKYLLTSGHFLVSILHIGKRQNQLSSKEENGGKINLSCNLGLQKEQNKTGFYHVAQASLELHVPPISASTPEY